MSVVAPLINLSALCCGEKLNGLCRLQVCLMNSGGKLISEQIREIPVWTNPEDPQSWSVGVREELELLEEKRRIIFCAGDEEVINMCLLQLGSPDCSCDPSVRGGDVHVAAERKAGDQCWKEADRLLENLPWPRVGETGGHQAVSGVHGDSLWVAVCLREIRSFNICIIHWFSQSFLRVCKLYEED